LGFHSEVQNPISPSGVKRYEFKRSTYAVGPQKFTLPLAPHHAGAFCSGLLCRVAVWVVGCWVPGRRAAAARRGPSGSERQRHGKRRAAWQAPSGSGTASAEREQQHKRRAEEAPQTRSVKRRAAAQTPSGSGTASAEWRWQRKRRAEVAWRAPSTGGSASAERQRQCKRRVAVIVQAPK